MSGIPNVYEKGLALKVDPSLLALGRMNQLDLLEFRGTPPIFHRHRHI